ncbi:TonB-dependent receptor [Alkalimonas sp. NCh-2]|uniref:TonB-dependent receptor plug domain-containing protein n=1 Tax=Alkalimonas sp. NCh-2 TaxID=3144846 RepID=UPI0031F6FBF1
MRLSYLVCSLGLGALLGAGWSHAASVELGRVLVLAEGLSQEEERQLNPVAKQIIDRTELDKFDDQTVGQVLRRVVGISYSGPPGVVKDVRMRGMDKGYTQLLIDGEPVLGTAGKEQLQVDRLPAALIERIEIMRNPTADVELAGVGGTINIVLRKAPEQRLASYRLGAGVQGDGRSGELGLLFGNRSSDFGWLLNASAQRRLERLEDERRQLNADGSLRQRQTEQKPADIDEYSLAPRFDWQITEQWQLEVDPYLSWTREDKEKAKQEYRANGALHKAEQEQEERDRLLSRLRLGLVHQHEAGHRTRLRLSSQYGREDKDKWKQEFDGQGQLSKNEAEWEEKREREHSLRLVHERAQQGLHRWRFGADVRELDRDGIKEKARDGIHFEPDKSETLDERYYALWLDDEIQLHEQHILTLGARYEQSRRRQDFDPVANKPSVFSPSAHYQWWLGEQTIVRSSIARTVRLPKLGDISSMVEEKDGDIFKPDKSGNPELRAERATGLELGLEHYLAAKQGLVVINAFQRRITDLIEKTTRLDSSTGRYIERPDNVGNASLYGLELEGRYALDAHGLPGLQLSANYSRLYSKVDLKNDQPERRMKDQPKFTANLGMDYQWSPQLSFGVAFNYLAATVEDEVPDGKLKIKRESAKRLLDAYLAYDFGSGYRLRLSGSNLLQDTKSRTEQQFNLDGSLDRIELRDEMPKRLVALSFEGRF